MGWFSKTKENVQQGKKQRRLAGIMGEIQSTRGKKKPKKKTK